MERVVEAERERVEGGKREREKGGGGKTGDRVGGGAERGRGRRGGGKRKSKQAARLRSVTAAMAGLPPCP